MADASVHEMSTIRIQWTTGEGTLNRVNDGKKVYIASPEIEVPPYTMKLPMEDRLALMRQGYQAGMEFIMSHTQRVWGFPTFFRHGH